MGSSPQLPLRQQRIIWSAIGGSIVIVTGVVPLILPPLAADALLGPVLVVAGVFYVLPAAVLARQSAWARRLIGLALLDSAAIMSCAAWLISGTPIFWVPGAAALVGWGLSFPSEAPPQLMPPRPEMDLPPPIG